MFASRFVGQKLFLELENWFAGLPLIKVIYPTLKQIVSFISAQKEFGFKWRCPCRIIQAKGYGLWGF